MKEVRRTIESQVILILFCFKIEKKQKTCKALPKVPSAAVKSAKLQIYFFVLRQILLRIFWALPTHRASHYHMDRSLEFASVIQWYEADRSFQGRNDHINTYRL